MTMMRLALVMMMRLALVMMMRVTSRLVMVMSPLVTCGGEPAEAGRAGGPGLSPGGSGGKTRSLETESANLRNTNEKMKNFSELVLSLF